MTKTLYDVRGILAALAQEVDVLPAVGGAIEDLERPDFEEREDRAINEEERVFEAVFERGGGALSSLYRPVPPIGRQEAHLYRYFLDGSFRSYFLGTLLEGDRESPLHFAQVGACLLRREEDGAVRRQALEVRSLLLAGKIRLSDRAWGLLEAYCAARGITLADLTEQDIVSRVLSDFDLRNKAEGKIRYAMHCLEAEMLLQGLERAESGAWLIADGSLLFEPILRTLSQRPEIPRVIGVAKNFRKDPQFVVGRGPRAQRHSIFQLLAGLEAAHRTLAFSAREGRVVFWYVRLREQKELDYPLMGVVKVELANPSQEPLDSALIDHLSQALVAERSVTPHGRDRRWHAHLYPIYLAEQAIKESLFSRDVVQQYLRWR